MVYFGISQILNHKGVYTSILDTLDKSGSEAMEMSLNVDGLPVFNSSRNEFWPLLGRICHTVFLIGYYFGPGKPTEMNLILEDVVEDIINLQERGVVVNGRLFPFRLKLISADAPARSSLLKIKSHSGYYSCMKCKVKGEMVGGSVRFVDLAARPRTNDEFLLQADHGHHRGGISLLTRIPNFNFVEQVPNDYMHSLCLGVMKVLLQYWITPPTRNKTILTSSHLCAINNDLTNLSRNQYCPSYFSRSPRHFAEIKNFKATEFRQILLYTGPIIFRNRLHGVHTQILLHLFVISRMLIRFNLEWHPDKRKKRLSFVKGRLKWLIQTISTDTMYGKEFCTYNLHSLYHLPQDCAKFGSLDNFSCFYFESFLYRVKNCIHGGYLPAQQLVNKYSEYLYSVSEHRPNDNCLSENTPSLSHPYDSATDHEYNGFLQCRYKRMWLRGDRKGNAYVKIGSRSYMEIKYFLQRKMDSCVFASGKPSEFPLFFQQI